MSTPSPETIASTLAQGFAFTRRVPVLRRPDEYGLAYEDVTFPSQDCTPLEGWFIPADSDKLVIANHPMPANRYGYPGHLPQYATPFADFEINFLPDCKTSTTPATTSSPTTCATTATAPPPTAAWSASASSSTATS
ncbi:hypothetical protein [Streptomyces sp. S3(2020)]|uniref:hypothetical protein n=1 Tax=Streptomyces sp. S3(2020) TaxID=2732044 RepID=UPI0019D13DE6|nr:hypothetical protein [Streptomyces sp. S3(2020)]